ncbi:hypothetical protein [Streptomyces sp. LN549]|uniref:hypothetical protein n=1 Tax=Streptomyces sp. LN549 TaxID=3112979 RepID=UPI00371BAD9C
MTTPEAAVSELLGRIDQLARWIDTQRSRIGEPTELLRLVNDVERLRIDAAGISSALRSLPSPQRHFVAVSDVPYDPNLWLGADDEGVGGQPPYGQTSRAGNESDWRNRRT